MRLLRLASEQNALLRHLVTRGAVSGDDLAEPAAAPEPVCSEWESLEYFLSHKPRTQINEEILEVFKRMCLYLIDQDERVGLLDLSSELARHRKQVIKQLENLLEDPNHYVQISYHLTVPGTFLIIDIFMREPQREEGLSLDLYGICCEPGPLRRAQAY